MTRDHAGRVKEILYGQGNTAQHILSSSTYNARDQIETQIVGDDLQTVNYSYLTNGFLETINGASLVGNDLYQQKLSYNSTQSVSHGVVAKRNGLIANWQWKTSGKASKYYAYKYDHADRVRGAYLNGSQSSNFSTEYIYDKRGNIKDLRRRGSNGDYIDFLLINYTSNSNRISFINDIASSKHLGYNGSVSRNFSYDANGNQNVDESRQIDLTHNIFNLINKAEKSNDNSTYTSFSYDAQGQQLMRFESSTDTETVYLDNMEFTNGEISKVHHPHGYLTYEAATNTDLTLQGNQSIDVDEYGRTITSSEKLQTGTDVNYWGVMEINLNNPFEVVQGAEFLADFKPYGREGFIWQLTDHLGQVRVLFDDFGNKIQDYDYYPFGMRHLYWLNADQDRNRTGVIEQSGILENIDLFSFRAYDRSLGRFIEVDPISSQFPHVSGYNNAENKVPNGIDLHGLQFVPHFDINLNSGLSSEERVELQKGIMQGSKVGALIARDVGIGFTPAGPAVDAKDFRDAAAKGDKLGMGLAGIGFLSGPGDFLKGIGKTIRNFFKSSNKVRSKLNEANPVVKELGNFIEDAMPGSIIDVEKIIVGSDGLKKTDLDLVLKDFVIEVTGGKGTGKATQIQNKIGPVTNKQVIIFGENLTGSVQKELKKRKIKFFTNKQNVLDFLKNK